MSPLPFTAVDASFLTRPTLNVLPVEILREVLFYLHPNDLPFLAAVNRHLNNAVPI
ncbi:hypothetical protein HDU96_003335, partial [Phlyctochytrium bullatum]